MTAVLILASAIYGLLVGSFLNVVIHRVPAGRSVLRPRSSCPACDTPIAPRDNVPVVSWMVLRGRCRTCETTISVRYPAVEALTAVVFVGLALRFGATAELPAFAILAAGLIAVSIIDLDCRRIPTPILHATTILGGAVLVAAAIARGDAWPLVRAGLGGLGCFAALGTIWAVQPRGLGFGDVRLAGVMGGFLGWLGPLHPAIGLFLGFLLGASAGVALMAVGRADRRTAVPFGPFLSCGALMAVWVGSAIARWYSG